ncbi:MAG: hypothetical protein RBS17_05255 [Coriobacteriia bacterium]|nr:hypothetical protein [Coriobacteriia bacterium]
MCAGASLLVLAMIAGCAGVPAGEAIEGPVLAVLSYSPHEVILVAPDTLDVIKRVRLRSGATDPLALAELRMFVTAQCGGLGVDGDDAIGLIDLSQGGRIRYVKLPEQNPGSVESVGDGTVLVSHGVWDPGGIPVTRVDPETGTVIGHELVANAYNSLVVAAGSLWTSGPEGENIVCPDYTVRRTSLDLATSDAYAAVGRGPFVAPDGDSPDTLLLATDYGESACVSRVSARSLEVLMSATVEDLRNGIYALISAGDLFVARDSSGEDMADPGGPLIVLDHATLREVRRIDVGGSVASIAAIGEIVYAVTWDTGELIEVDPMSGDVLRRVRLEGLDGKMLELAAMDVVDVPGGP